MFGFAMRHAARGCFKHSGLCVVVLLAGTFATPARGQRLLTGRDDAAANQVFDSTSRHELLPCKIDSRKPRLDFTLRFYAGYLVTCPFLVTGGIDTPITVLSRVTPEGGKPVLLEFRGLLRGSPARELSLLDPQKANEEFPIKGRFSVGEGRYHVEVIVVDNRFRECRRDWMIEVTPHQQAKSPVTLAAHAVSPLDVPVWGGALAGADGIRLTVLLEAPPIYRSKFDRMTAWDRVLLLQILSSLLEQTPCRSVRLVTFSLEQQKEIFRADPFEPSGITKLQDALAELDLRIVPVSVLQHPNGWIEMLSRLVQQEVNYPTPSDAVVFLGQSDRWMRKLPPAMLKLGGNGKPQLFALQGFVTPKCKPNGRDCLNRPDVIANLVKGRGGTVYRIFSPHDLIKATQKMVEKVRR